MSPLYPRKTCSPHQREKLITLAHASLAAGYPEVYNTSTTASKVLVEQNTHRQYICSYSTWTKVQRTLPAGKLLSLSTPQHPWSHLALDFITHLWPSKQNKTILMDGFSKTLQILVPLPALIAFKCWASVHSNVILNIVEPLRTMLQMTEPSSHQTYWRNKVSH